MKYCRQHDKLRVPTHKDDDTCPFCELEESRRGHEATLKILMEDRRAIIDAIYAEPELEGEMPDEVWNTIKTKEDANALCQLTTRLTKKGILDRINARYEKMAQIQAVKR